MKLGFCFGLLLCTPFLIFGQNVETGEASFYAKGFDRQLTANEEHFNQSELTGAHKELPFGTKVRVTNLANNKTVVVRINDRGPYVPGRVIDLTRSAAKKLGFIHQGITNVKIQVVDESTPVGEFRDLADSDSIRLINLDGDAFVEKNPSSFTKGENKLIAKKTRFYKPDAKRIKPEGYGIEIKSYTEKMKAFKRIDQLKARYDKSVVLEVADVEGIKVFNVVLSNFKSYNQADRYKENEIIQGFPDAFVINLKKSGEQIGSRPR